MGDFGTISTVPEGFLLGDRYEIRRVIGQGGMGIVYLAIDKQLNEVPRAIKTVRPEILVDPRGVRQLKREAKAALRLSHPNIVNVFHYEEWQGTAFVVMEFVEGFSLAELIAEREQLTSEEFLSVAKDVCEALEYAHQAGVIHQDIKPSNIFIDGDGAAKLADFGIARVTKDATTRLTGVMPSGTLVYMSPELLRGGQPSFAGDIYSLGVTFYEMMAGEPPFIRGDIYRQHQEVAPAPIEGIDRQLCWAVLSGLEKDPADRPESAMDYYRRLVGEDTVTRPTFALMVEPEEGVTDSIGMALRLVPAGSFVMGSDDEDAYLNETPAHRVVISKPYYIGIHPVTQQQYEQVMGENPSIIADPACPVSMVSWEDAQRFCQKLSEVEGIRYRLPTEAEWEYAARAGARTDFYWGSEMDGRCAWYIENSSGRVQPVGRKRPNAWGLFDMLGNVLEWCSDWYGEVYYFQSPEHDPQGIVAGGERALRGGSYNFYPRFVQVASRFMKRPEKKEDFIGFRCVREV